MPASRGPARAARGRRARALALALLLALGGPACKGSAPPPRVPTAAEAGSEQVVVNYAPPKLRVLPIASPPEPGAGPAEARYLILGSERPGLPAVFRPLGVTERKAPIGAASRAGSLAWVDGHVVEVAPPAAGAGAADTLTLQVFDRDAKVPRPRAVAIGCSAHGQPLLASDSTTLWALVRCGGAAIVLTLDGEGGVRARREVPGGGEAELFLPSGEDFYVLAGSKVLRSAPGGPPAIGSVPGRGGSSETRELVRAGELLLVLDGAAGRVSALDAAGLGARYEQRFVSGGPISRLRAAASGDRLIIVWAEPRAGEQSELVALALPLSAPGDRAPQRILLGSGPQTSDHELVPVPPADGGGALLVRTHASNTGPLVALLHVKL
ncbi:MAG: hypothetical protein U1A78_07215 [Polyangia bacterium]